jgi:signal transduction histidine kinase
MRVLRKLLLAFCAVFLVVLTVGEYLTARQEVEQLERLVKADLRHEAYVLVSTTRHRWEEVGEAQALADLARHQLADSGPRIRWLPQGSARPRSDDDFIRLTRPLVVAGVERGAIELSQSREYLERYERRRISQLVVLELSLFAATLVLIYGVGTRLFGARLARLVEQARRIGAGDLGARVDAAGNDEITALARQMNATSDQLLAGRTALETAEAERLQALEQMRHSDRLASIGRLSSVLAHELGTPLNVVLARAKLIAEHAGDVSEVIKNAEIVHRQAQRMTESIRATLGLARRGAALSRVEVCEAARDALRLIEPLARRKGVRLVLGAAQGPAWVQARRGEIEQVVTNLLSNALDAVENGGNIELDVETVAAPAERHRGGRFQRIRVRDDGCGIAAADLEHVFQAFHTTKGDGQGTGLGLWILDGIARDHGGWIDVDSRPGAGTAFEVYLPAAEPA